MSGKVAGQIFALGRYEGSTLIVALALAEYADDDGREIFPKVETLAAKAKLSTRMTQYALRALQDDGVLVMVKRACRWRPAVYRLDLDRIRALGCNPLHPYGEVRGANCDSVGVQSIAPLDGLGVQSVAPPIEPPQDKPPKEAPRAREISAHAQEAAPPTLPAHGSRRPAQREMLLPMASTVTATPEQELLLAEFRRVPGYSMAWGIADVLAGLAALGADCPPPAALCEAVRAYARWLDAENSKRGPRDGKRPMSRPSNWLKRREFDGFLNTDGEGRAASSAPAIAIHPSWAEWEARAIAAVGGRAKFAAWLGGTELVFDERRAIIRTRTGFARSHIADQFGFALARLFGREVVVEIAKAERAA
jgi:hypothetical protein